MIRSTFSVTDRARVAAIALALATAFPASRALADGDESFARGKALLEAGHLSEACEVLTLADHDKPTVATIGLLAACHEKQGRTATAWREYQETARRAASAHDERERFALERIAKLEPTVPKLVVRLPRGERLSVTVRGEKLDPGTTSASIRVDPGPVEIVATSPEGKRWAKTVTLEPSEERAFEIPSLSDASSTAPKRTGAPPWPALVAGGVGVVGVGFVTGFGISATLQNADSVKIEVRCKAGTASSAECARGKDERARARTFGNVATGGLVVGAAGLGTAAVLWILDVGGHHEPSRPTARAVEWAPFAPGSDVGLGVQGRF